MHDIIPSKSKEPVRLDWKLPARLRRPVASQRRKNIHFQRKKITTIPSAPGIALSAHHFFHTNIERHTRDVLWREGDKKQYKRFTILQKHTKTIIPRIPDTAFAERDVAYTFAPEVPDALVQEPRARGIPSVLLLMVGCAIASLLIWTLQGAGRGTAILSSLEARAMNAFQSVATAQHALANRDTATSVTSFQDATREISLIQKEIDTALSSSQHLLRVLDVTKTVRSGQHILDAGAALARAGEHMSRAVSIVTEKTEDKTLTDAIVAAGPELDFAHKELSRAQELLSGISLSLLPPEFSAHVEGLQQRLPPIIRALETLQRESHTLLTLLGAQRDKQYLFLFTNNDEIRPVGGFIGTVGLVNIDRGAVENIDVRSVYDNDGQLKEFLAPPNPLLSIVDRWYLRDSNWFVDFAKSAQKATELFEKEGGPTVDGVVLITPEVIKNLLAITGPIEVPGYSHVVSAENFVQVTQGEVTYHYDRIVNKPKQFLSDLTPILLNKIFAFSDIRTLSAITKSLQEKDLLLFFQDEVAQREVTRLGWGGTLPEDASGFLLVNHANIGGHKTDQFIEQEIDYRTIITEEGDADVVVTVRRSHRGLDEKIDYPYPDREDPSLKANVVYQRILVPKGALFLDSKGYTSQADIPRPLIQKRDIPMQADADVAAWQVSQRQSSNGTSIGSESGYTFFANWIVTKPGETSVALTHYRIPHAVQMPSYLHPVSSYSVDLFKQPGQKRTNVRAAIQIPDSMKIVHTLPDSGITQEKDTLAVYRGDLTQDRGSGIVFERK